MGLLLALTPVGRPLDRALHDLQVRLIAPRQASADVVVVDIDDASLARLRQQLDLWPFKRDVYALAIEQLRESGARAIALDLLLVDSQPGDVALARAIDRPGAPVVLAAAGLQHTSDGTLAAPLPTPGAARAQGPAFPGMATAAAAARVAPDRAQRWPALALPVSSVWPGGREPLVGVITAPLDSDGLLRSLPLWHHDGQQRQPAMPMALHLALDAPQQAAWQQQEGSQVLAMPARPHGPLVLPFADLMATAMGGPGAQALRDAVVGRVVFIGSSALLADPVMTAQGQLSGTQVLAQAYADLLRGNGPRPPLPLLDAGLLLLALLPALWAVRQGRPRPGHNAMAAGLALLLLGAVASAALWGWRQPAAWAPALGALAVGLAAALMAHHRSQRLARLRLARELEVAAAAARAKSAFLATVSHEMRTPLNALLGMAELLARSPLNNEQQRQVQIFRDSGLALQSLIDDLLDLSKIEAGRLSLEVAPFALRAMLDHVLALLRPRADAKGLQLLLHVAPGLPACVQGDSPRLQQSLVNLLGNAIKFTPGGSVRLAVRQDAGDARLLCFDVSDTGIGIAADKLEAIFEPFAQADGSVTRLYGGTGLGLAITRNVMMLMGGTVQVRSVEGQGSTFTLRLPLPQAPMPDAAVGADAAGAPVQGPVHVPVHVPVPVPAAHALPVNAPAPGPAPAEAPSAARVLQVLLAEDNEVNAYIFSAMLEGQPVHLQHAADGHAALERLQAQAFDIAFIDVQMPGLDGLSVTRALRALEASTGRRATPVVALTANAFASDVQASLDAGCQQHLAKPCSREQLLQAIAALAAGAGA